MSCLFVVIHITGIKFAFIVILYMVCDTSQRLYTLYLQVVAYGLLSQPSNSRQALSKHSLVSYHLKLFIYIVIIFIAVHFISGRVLRFQPVSKSKYPLFFLCSFSPVKSPPVKLRASTSSILLFYLFPFVRIIEEK
jgi:hypothetical protein